MEAEHERWVWGTYEKLQSGQKKQCGQTKPGSPLCGKINKMPKPWMGQHSWTLIGDLVLSQVEQLK